MKKFFKTVLPIMLVCLIVVGLVGCGPEPAANKDAADDKPADDTAAKTEEPIKGDKGEDERLKIGCTVYYMSEFVTLMKEGIMKEAEEQNAELIFLDANNDVNKQISQIENLIAQDVDALLVAAVDSDAIVPVVDMAKEAGIPLVGLNMLINTDQPYYYAGPNDVEAGELEMQYIVDKLDGEGNIVILDGPIGVSAQLQRKEGNQNVLAENPGITVLAEQTANWSRAEALSLMENWLQSFEGQIDGVVAHNDEMALGAIQALEAKGLKDTIPVSGVDAIKDACVSINDGIMDATVFQDADAEGRLGVEIAAKVARGEDVDPMQQYIKMELITKDNVSKLLDTIYK